MEPILCPLTLRCHSPRKAGNLVLLCVLGYWVARFRACETISDLILRSAPSARLEGWPRARRLCAAAGSAPVAAADPERVAVLRDARRARSSGRGPSFFHTLFRGDDTAVGLQDIGNNA